MKLSLPIDQLSWVTLVEAMPPTQQVCIDYSASRQGLHRVALFYGSGCVSKSSAAESALLNTPNALAARIEPATAQRCNWCGKRCMDHGGFQNGT